MGIWGIASLNPETDTQYPQYKEVHFLRVRWKVRVIVEDI